MSSRRKNECQLHPSGAWLHLQQLCPMARVPQAHWGPRIMRKCSLCSRPIWTSLPAPTSLRWPSKAGEQDMKYIDIKWAYLQKYIYILEIFKDCYRFDTFCSVTSIICPILINKSSITWVLMWLLTFEWEFWAMCLCHSNLTIINKWYS